MLILILILLKLFVILELQILILRVVEGGEREKSLARRVKCLATFCLHIMSSAFTVVDVILQPFEVAKIITILALRWM